MTIICRVLSHFPAASSAAAGSGAFSRHASMRVRRSTAGRSMDSVRGLRLNGSVPSHSRCRLMVSRSTTWPDPGSTTGSFITVCRMGSMNSSGMSRAYSVSRCSSMAARAVLTRETKSRRRPRRARDTSPAVKCAAHSKSQRKSSWDRSQLDDASSVQMESDGRTCEGETPLPPPPPQESPPPLQSPPPPPRKQREYTHSQIKPGVIAIGAMATRCPTGPLLRGTLGWARAETRAGARTPAPGCRTCAPLGGWTATRGACSYCAWRWIPRSWPRWCLSSWRVLPNTSGPRRWWCSILPPPPSSIRRYPRMGRISGWAVRRSP
mmetsp:Transcript_23321/g.57784  ORF Transcript_23321/g.57784 Transcript_23321/m.57784 type:complete len:322 (-) Transcript_23321:895-1860(-)